MKNRIARFATVVLFMLGMNAANAQLTVPGTANPWLAGMPNGTNAGGVDSAPVNSPILFNEFAIHGGDVLQIVATGSVANGPAQPFGLTPDGTLNIWKTALYAPQNGIANIQAPHRSLIGVFLNDSRPNLSPAPSALDFAVIGTDFHMLSPELRQPFFIGDGAAADGYIQSFIVPQNATRLFLGVMDGSEWRNNQGSFRVLVSSVPEPSELMMLSLGGLLLSAIARRRHRQ